jgi:Cellulase (glycosyl hydrolase family 5)
MKNSSNRPGVSPLAVAIIILLLVSLGGAGWYLYHRNHSTASPPITSPGSTPTTPRVTTTTEPASTTTGTYNVVGNKIIGPDGKQFVPYGFVIECMAKTGPIDTLCQANSENPNSGSELVSAAATYWHANVLRFQVSQEALFSGPGGSVDQTYLDLVDHMVEQANDLGMVAIVTLQEEEYDKTKVLPDASSVTFWKFMADNFKGDPGVFFDMYNEPRLLNKDAGGEDATWSIWQHGGTVDGDTYVGMQAIVDTIRSTGAMNIIIAESNYFDTDLSQIMTHLLSGSNIAYGFEPGINHTENSPAQWTAAFGQYAAQIPLMPEAFIQYIGGHGCDGNDPTVLPQLLEYLREQNIGIIVFSLESGITYVGNDPTSPTSYGGAESISCPAYNGIEQPIQGTAIGDGQTILDYFKDNSPNSK